MHQASPAWGRDGAERHVLQTAQCYGQDAHVLLIARTQLTHRSANSTAKERTQRYPALITNLIGNQINTVTTCTQQLYRPRYAQILKIGKRRLAQHSFQAACECSR